MKKMLSLCLVKSEFHLLFSFCDWFNDAIGIGSDLLLEFTGRFDTSQLLDDLFVLVEKPSKLVPPVTHFILFII